MKINWPGHHCSYCGAEMWPDDMEFMDDDDCWILWFWCVPCGYGNALELDIVNDCLEVVK